jgi:hypothetical protein
MNVSSLRWYQPTSGFELSLFTKRRADDRCAFFLLSFVVFFVSRPEENR